MSRENVEIVESLVEHFRAGDSEAVFAYYDPSIEWDARRGQAHVPDIAELYRGHDGVRTYWRRWLSAWETIDFDEEIRNGDDENVVLLVTNQRNRGRRSGVEVEIAPYALVFTFDAGKVVRWAFYSDPDEGLEAAGLTP